MRRTFFCAIASILLGGCNIIENSATQSSQSSFITLDSDPAFYSGLISREEFEMTRLPPAVNTVAKSWVNYIGSREDFHFFAHTDFIGQRKIYRIAKAELEIPSEMPLTLDTAYWQSARKAFGLPGRPQLHPEPFENYQPMDADIDMSLFDEEALEALKEPIGVGL